MGMVGEGKGRERRARTPNPKYSLLRGGGTWGEESSVAGSKRKQEQKSKSGRGPNCRGVALEEGLEKVFTFFSSIYTLARSQFFRRPRSTLRSNSNAHK